MSPLGFILLMGMAAQNQPAPATQSEKAKLLQQMQASARAQALAQAQALGQRPFDPGVCYAIRSYIFKRQDGNAPVLIRTTTCTPANMVWPEQVAQPPRGRLVPQ